MSDYQPIVLPHREGGPLLYWSGSVLYRGYSVLGRGGRELACDHQHKKARRAEHCAERLAKRLNKRLNKGSS